MSPRTSASSGVTPRAGWAEPLVNESFLGMATSTGYATNSGVNSPRQSRKAGLLRVLLITCRFLRSKVFTVYEVERSLWRESSFSCTS